MLNQLQKYMSDAERDQFNSVALEPEKKQVKRNYNSARISRLTSDWVSAPVTANQALRNNLRVLRSRSRDVARNDPYAKKFLTMARCNIVGTGVNLQVRAQGRSLAADQKLSNEIEAKFKTWSKKEFASASGKLSWLECQNLFVTHLARDGEVLIRKIYDRKNPFGFSLKFYNGYWLDETYNSQLKNGNRIIMSVEVDDYEKPVAYYLTPPVADYLYSESRGRNRVRVPAFEIIHAYLLVEDEDQTRGVPWLHASMMRLKMLDGYEEAELVAARVEACQMAFFIPPADDAVNLDDEEPEQCTIEEAEPGVFGVLPPDYDVKQFDPKHPNANAEGFKKGTLRGVAAGADVSYHSLAGDLEAVNYSSARIGSLEDRDVWTALQTFVIENFCRPVFQEWFQSAILSGEIEITPKNYERLKEPVFRARGWAWVDPKKDAEASVIGLENNFITLTDILAERGIDLEDFLQTKKKEKEMFKTYGLDMTLAGYKPAPNDQTE